MQLQQTHGDRQTLGLGLVSKGLYPFGRSDYLQ